jgi:hypothetical protein
MQCQGGVVALGNDTYSDSPAGDDVVIDAAIAIPDEISEIPVVHEQVVANSAAGGGLNQRDAHVVVGQLVVRDYRARPGYRDRDSLVVNLIESRAA